MDVSIGEFLAYLRGERGLSLNTVESYRLDLCAMCNFLGVSELFRVGEKHLLRYFEHLKEKEYQATSVARKMIAVRSYFQFMLEEGMVKKSPVHFLQTPKIWQLVPDILTTEEFDAILSKVSRDDALGYRDYAIIHLLYASGVRVSELCMLDIKDVGERELIVYGKGGKQRIALMPKETSDAMDAYLACREDDASALFLSRFGKRLDRMSVWRIVKRYTKGMTKCISPHTFRHTFATHLLENGADLRIIQELLGHANIATTDRYTQITTKQLHAAFDSFHPLSESTLEDNSL